MNADLIVGLVLVAGGVLGVVLSLRPDTRPRVLTQGVQDSEADHGVEHEHTEGADDEPAKEKRRSIHGGMVHPGPIYLPPGIPSVAERLDRWEELS